MYCPDPWRRVRRKTRQVQVGPVTIGGDAPIVVQSMLTSDTRDTEACVKEALESPRRHEKLPRTLSRS